jgi:hypothetical protein
MFSIHSAEHQLEECASTAEQQEMIDLLREAMKLCSSDRCWWEERIGLWL